MRGPGCRYAVVQAAKEANRKRQEAKYANAGPFKLHTTERPTNIDKIRAEIEADIARQLTFQPPKANPMPTPPTTQVRMARRCCSAGARCRAHLAVHVAQGWAD